VAKKTKSSTRSLNSLRENFARWQSFASNIRRHLAEMPHIESHLVAFEENLVRIQNALAEQDLLASRSGALLRGRANDVVQARSLRHRLVGQLVGHFGVDSEALKQFGLRPKVSKRRTPAPPEEPAPQTPADKPEPT
jgi:hypothetical protein